MIPLDDDALARWRDELGKATTVAKTYEPWMEAVLRDYAPSARDNPEDYSGKIHTLRSFVLVERKKADLFYQRPDVTQVPSPLMDGPIIDPNTGQPMSLAPPQPGQAPQTIPQTLAVQANEEIVNDKLGPNGIDAKKLIHQVLFDVLATAGSGWTKMGYDSVTIDQQEVDPLTGSPRTVPVPVYERCYWDYIPPKQCLRPAEFRSTEWDRAPWLAFRFTLPLTKGNRQKYKLPDDFEGAPDESQQHFDHGVNQSGARKVFTGIEIWYRSCLYREDIVHPEHFTQLVLVDGRDEPAIHQDSPHQTLDARGQLTPDSLLGNPIHPFNVRSLTDSSFVPSDAMMVRALEKELDTFRTQMVEYRDAMILRWGYRVSTVDPEKFIRSPVGGMVGLPDAAFPLEQNLVELPHGSMPRESFTSNDYIDADIARAGGVDASGAGVQDSSSQTATAEQRQQANTNARFDFERGIILDRYIAGVTKFAQLLMRWLPLQQAAQILGPQRAAYWDAWRKTVPAPIAFTALPDSALRTDQAADRKQAQELYSFLANDPYVAKGRAKLLEKLLRKFHIDPSGIVSPPDPPRPEPPKLNLSFSGPDLVSPQGPIVLEILKQLGVQIDPATVQTAMAMQQQSLQMAAEADAAKAARVPGETRHGGKLAPQESLSKHASDLTGGMQGSGEPAPLGMAGGQIQ